MIAVKNINDGLGRQSHLVDAAIPEINHLFWMAQGPLRVSSPAGVPSVCARGSVASLYRSPHTGVADYSRKAAIALALKLAVPAGCRHPDFDLDVRVTGWGNLHHDPAKGWNVRIHRRRTSVV